MTVPHGRFRWVMGCCLIGITLGSPAAVGGPSVGGASGTARDFPLKALTSSSTTSVGSILLTIGSATAVPAQQMSLPIQLSGGSADVSTILFDVVFDPAKMAVNDVQGGPVAIAAGKQTLYAAVGQGRVRVLVYGDRTTISDGVLVNLRCTLLGSVGLQEVVVVAGADGTAADPDANRIDVSFVDGQIVAGTAEGEGEGEGEGEPFWTLTVNVEGEGLVVRTPDLESYPDGTTVVLDAQADSCWVFGHWAADRVQFGTRVQVTMSDNIVVTAVFVESGETPEAPTALSASDGAYSDRVLLTWNASAGATAYEIYRNVREYFADAELIATVASPSVAYQDTSAAGPGDVVGCTGKTQPAEYYYWVVAQNACGNSPPSAPDAGYCASATKVASVQLGHMPGVTAPIPASGAVFPHGGRGDLLVLGAIAGCLARRRVLRRDP